MARPKPGDAPDPLDRMVALSNQVGADTRLVQPGGGNSSVKVRHPTLGGGEEEVLWVKGSGTDLRSIARAGFTPLSMARLAGLREREDMSDEEMMAFMRGCMLDPGAPAPSVETPLHSILPHRAIVHTHDVATMSLTNLADERAEALVAELFGGEIFYLPYARPGFPLARSVLRLADEIPGGAVGATLAHHGLVVWGDDADACRERLRRVVARIEDYVETRRRGRRLLGTVRVATPDAATRQRRAELLLPVIRGELGRDERVILDWDDDEELLDRLASERMAELSERGVATPEHILRAGRRPLWLGLDLASDDEKLVASARESLRAARAEYETYHARNRRGDEAPIPDWAKVVLVPGLGMVTAFRDKKSARVAGACYRATLEAIEGAEALGGFRFLPEAQVFEFEHWPLERRKVEEGAARERREKLLPRRIAVVLGAGSGIGAAAARRFAEEGACVVVSDLDGERVAAVAAGIEERHPGRALGVAADVRDEASLAELFRRTVLAFGGLDAVFYSAGKPPRFAPIVRVRREDLLEQAEIHYVGAVLAMREAARVLRRQGLGGSIVCSVSKAALAPGREAVAYGGSKAALQQALRVAALELGADGVRVNAINADQVDTPLFRRFVEERAASRGKGFEEQLAAYRERNALGASLIPPDAVAEIAVWLASDRTAFTTGDILTVDGGLPDAMPR